MLSCSPLQYQVLEISGDNIPNAIKDDVLISGNEDVQVSYNFWSFGGSIAFTIENKTNKPIFLDWDKCHFIIGGFSYEYWYDIEENTQYAIAKSISQSGFSSSYSYYNSFWNTKTSSITTIQKSKPKRILQIPSKSSIYVKKFSILNKPYFTCDFNFKGSSQHLSSKEFTRTDSPINFRNYLTYSFDKDCDSSKVIDDGFYISKVSNMSKKLFNGESKTTKNCDIKGNSVDKQTFEFPQYGPNKFYWDINAK